VPSPGAGALIQITGVSGTTNVPSPVLYPGATQQYYNASGNAQTLSTPQGNFTGLAGSGSATLAVPNGMTAYLYSDGSNWLVMYNTGGVVNATSGSFTGSFTVNPLNLNVGINPTGSGQVTISSGAAGTINNMSIGQTTALAGSFTTLSASSTVAGQGFLNYFASPPTIGNGTPNTGAFSTLSANSTVTFSPANANITISPTGSGNVTISPAGSVTMSPTTIGNINNMNIGGSTPASGSFTNLASSGSISGTGFSNYLTTAFASPGTIGSTAANSGAFTTLNASGAVNFTGSSTLTVASTFTASSAANLNGNVTFGASINILAGSNRIQNVADPTNAQDAATKNYADTYGGKVTAALAYFGA
jgi:hypothetical protein